jgi:O-antigen/teichoic acid export membrane protein
MVLSRVTSPPTPYGRSSASASDAAGAPVDDAPSALDHDATGAVLRSAGWLFVGQGGVQFVSFITSILMARLLVPHDIGLAAMALVFTRLSLILVDSGFGNALIQKAKVTEDDASTAFWVSMLLGVGTTLLGVALSWPIAELYGEPQLQAIFAVMSLGFLLTAPGIVQGALLSRAMAFRSLELRTLVATMASSATAVTLAALGAGVWSIVAQDLVIISVSTALLWKSSKWRPSWRFSRASLRGMSEFVRHLLGVRTLSWGVANVDNMLIGRALGAASLGAYAIAYNVIVVPGMRVAAPLSKVFFPALAKLRDPKRLALSWIRALRMLAVLMVPVMLGLVVVAPEVVVVVFGAKWREAIPVLQLLAPVGLIQGLQALTVIVLQAAAETRVLFRFTFVSAVLTIAAFAVGLHWGIDGVAAAYLIVTAAVEPVLVWLTARALQIPAWTVYRSLSGVAQAVIVMLAATIATRDALMVEDEPTVLRLAIVVLVGAAVYVPLVWWRVPELRTEVRGLVRRVKARRAG